MRAMRAAEASRRASFRATNRTLELAWKASNAGSWNDGVLQRGNTRQNKRGAAHRPGLADAEVVGVSVLPYAGVPCERAPLLGKESAAARHRRGLGAGSFCAGMGGGGGSRRRRRWSRIQDIIDARERWRHWPLESISEQVPAARPHTRGAALRKRDSGRLTYAVDRGGAKAGKRAYTDASAVSTLMVEGKLPLNRFSPRFLRR